MDAKIYNTIKKVLQNNQKVDLEKHWKRIARNCSIQDEKLMYHNQRVIQNNKMYNLLWLYHNDPLAGYFRVNKTTQCIKEIYYWPNMDKNIKKYVESCHICQIQGIKKKQPEPTSITPVAP